MHRNSIFNRALLLIVLSASVVSCVTVDPQYEPWPENTRAQLHIDLGHIYLERRQPNVAKEEFNKALAIDEQSDQALHGLGLIEAQALDLDKAKDYFAKAVSLNSQNLKAVSDYAILTCRSGDTSSGITLLKRTQANSKKPDTMSMYLALGRCYQLAQENDLSAQALTRVLQINPKLPQALFSMAEIRFEQNEAMSARAFIQRFFSTNSRSSKALLLGARIENNLGNMEGKNKYIKTLREQYPQSVAWQEAKKEFN